MDYSTAAIRSLLMQAFSSEELRAFCTDYFQDVFKQFTDTQTKGAQVQLLVEHAIEHNCFDELLDRVRDANPAKYAEFADRLIIKPTGVATPTTQLILEPVRSRPLLIGRERELSLYRQILAQERSVIISGLAGIGKTTLGVYLAQQAAEATDQIFWFTFDRVQKNTSEALFRALAAFLAAHGQTSLEQYLDGEISTQKPLDLTAKLNLFIAGLTSGDYILCFDDFHLVKDAADIAHLFSEIRDRYPGARAPLPARFIIMGREMPETMQYLAPEALGGLNEADTRAFLLANSLNLSDTLSRRLWQRTTGNPKLLELSVTALARLAGDSAAITHLIDTMAAQRNLRDFVMHEIYESLSPVERVVAGALSIFPTAIPQEVVESILAGEEVKDIIEVLDALIGKNLASESEGRVGCHSLVREFSYRLLSREDAETFHGRAADYYEREKTYVTAAYHRYEQGAETQAANLLTENRQEIVNAGQAGAMLEQLNRFQRENLTAEQWNAVCRAKGMLYETRGDFVQALQTYETGLEEAIGDQDRSEWLCRIGHTYLVKGEYAQTLAYCQRCLETYDGAADPSHIADAHYDMGWAYLRMNRLDEADNHFLQCRQIAQTHSDHHREAKATLGLGAVAWMQDKLAEAKQCYEQSRRGFYQTGDRVHEAKALNNLALIAKDQGHIDQELAHYRQAMRISQEIGDVETLCIVLNNMGYTYLRAGDYDQATKTYQELADLAQSTGFARMLSTAYAGLADAYLATGAQAKALELAQAAKREADAGGTARETGISRNVLGKVWLALNQPARAKTCFEQAIPFLEEAQEEDDLAQARAGLASALAHPTGEASAQESHVGQNPDTTSAGI